MGVRFLGLVESILFLLLVAICLPGCSPSPGDAITDVLNQCAAIGSASAQYEQDQGIQARFIATEFQRVDVSACPGDFRMAFQVHVFAWQNAEEYLAKNTLGTAFLEGFLAGLTDNPAWIGKTSSDVAVANQQINETYFTLTQVAAAHGARIPRSVAGE
ncbi:hypothetical protein [Phragmitibacter flavus]|nr:hypothetical protein [Phragmitibacter flavus]